MVIIDIEDFFLIVLSAAFALFVLSILLYILKKGANYAKQIRTNYYCNICVSTFVDLEEKKYSICPGCNREVKRGLEKR